MKKILSLTLVLCMLLACAVTAHAEVPTVKFSTFTVFETLQGPGEEAVEKALNDHLDELGYQFHVDLEVVYGMDYITQMDMDLSSGMDVDAFLDLNYVTHAGQGSLLNLDPYLENELKEAASLFDQEWLDATKVGGVHYAIPNHGTASATYYYLCRKDLVEEMGYDVSKVKDLASLEEFFAAIKEAYPDMYCTDAYTTSAYLLPMSAEGIGYFSTYYGVCMSPENEGTMENMYTNQVFVDACYRAQDWYEKGYYSQNGSTDTTYSPDYITSGEAFGWVVGNANDAITQAKNYSNISGVELLALPLVDVPDSTPGFYFCIGQGCKHPSEAAQFLNLTYTDEFVLNTILYGIEGEDYVWKEEIQAYGYPEGKDRSTVPYSYVEGNTVLGDRLKSWAFEGAFTESDRAYVANKIVNNPRTPIYGMNLDTSSVTTQVAAVTNVVNQYYNSLMYGEVDVDTYLPMFQKALESAGINDIIAAAQAQYDAWKAAK